MAKKTEEKEKRSKHPEAKGLLLLSCSILLLLSICSFTPFKSDKNWLGFVGHNLAITLTYLFGLTSYPILGFATWVGWRCLCNKPIAEFKLKIFYFSLFTFSLSILLNVIAETSPGTIPFLLKNKVYSESVILHFPYPHLYTRYNLGGVPSYYLYRDLPSFNLQEMLSQVGVVITFSITSFVSFLLLTNLQLLTLLLFLKQKMANFSTFLQEAYLKSQESKLDPALSSSSSKESASIEKSLYQSFEPPVIKKPLPEGPKIKNFSDTTPKEKEISPPQLSKRESALQAQRVHNGDYGAYTLPPPSLLTSAKKVDQPSLKKELRRQAEILEETLLSFGIEAKVGEINCGPTITSFEVHPAVGVKVQKIKALENDIALNLQAKTIRIIAPIPGKAVVGVEIPSIYPQEVSFKELLLTYQQSPKKLHIPVLLGKAVNGDNVVSDLAKMPHCLIAGATGSGKSVCINTLIMSILMNAKPDEIKMVMIDPKKVELTSYTNLPHMIAPVITEPHGAYSALQWLVKEMQSRYEILKHLGMRNISAFNSRTINKDLESSLNITIPERMFAIVAIIDEFADLMMASSSDLETPIARIAQMARAVGIHLVLATQRPSREVITGLIKANFPTRITFKVASRINSQIIIDDTGAESLLGNGDMLFLPPGTSHLMRAQGAYLSDDDINKVISFICEQAKPNYLISSFDTMEGQNAFTESEENTYRDSLFEQARNIVIETQNASTTFLQRKLKIGYARAASLMDELEEKGIISAQEGSKPRRILQNHPLQDKEQEKKGLVYDAKEDFSD